MSSTKDFMAEGRSPITNHKGFYILIMSDLYLLKVFFYFQISVVSLFFQFSITGHTDQKLPHEREEDEDEERTCDHVML